MITLATGTNRPRTPARNLVLAVALAAALVLAGCGGSSDAAPADDEADQTTLADLNLTDRPLSGDSLDPAEELLMRQTLATEFEVELGVSESEATCLSESVEVSDLLEAGSATNGGDGGQALERVLQAFDGCGVPRSVFEQ